MSSLKMWTKVVLAVLVLYCPIAIGIVWLRVLVDDNQRTRVFSTVGDGHIPY